MKQFLRILTISISLTLPLPASFAEDPIILSDAAATNLRIQTVEAKPTDFTETLFAIGQVAAIPARKSVLSSRIAGRVSSIKVAEGDRVEAGQILVEIESLQPGDPPPRVTLQAPQAGMVMQSHTHVGKPVAPEKELFEIIDLSNVYAIARLPEDQAANVPLGALARIRVAALADRVFEAKLERFGTAANIESGTIDAFFILSNPNHRLRPNMRAEFSIVLESKPDIMAVPKFSVQTDGINHFVFVQDFDLPNAYLRTPVYTGSRNETHVEIIRGLFPGDKVVTQGSYALMFVGGGSISLKEALDTAHGHEHNEDGSEITPEQQANHSDGHDDDGSNDGPLVLFLSILSGLLFTLLMLALFKRQRT